MCSYDALICACPAIGDWVRIDQTQAECSREHDCLPDQICPIGDHFLTADVPARGKEMTTAASRLAYLLAMRL